MNDEAKAKNGISWMAFLSRTFENVVVKYFMNVGIYLYNCVIFVKKVYLFKNNIIKNNIKSLLVKIRLKLTYDTYLHIKDNCEIGIIITKTRRKCICSMHFPEFTVRIHHAFLSRK